MFPPKKKKPGLDVTIVAGAPGKSKGGDDIGDPGPLEPPTKKKPAAAAPPPDDEPEPGAEHEGAESAGYESTEDKGAKLISDIEQVGQQFGLDGPASQEFAASLFDALAACLR